MLMDKFFMPTISGLNGYTSFLPGPLMSTLVHFQSIPQCGIFSKSKLVICLPALRCSHLHSHLHSDSRHSNGSPQLLGWHPKPQLSPQGPAWPAPASSGLCSPHPPHPPFCGSTGLSLAMLVCHIAPSIGPEPKKMPVLGIVSPFLLIL